MIKDKENKFFGFLEKEKDKLYELENQNSKLKTTKAQLELLEEIYKFFGFKFLKSERLVSFKVFFNKAYQNFCFIFSFFYSLNCEIFPHFLWNSKSYLSYRFCHIYSKTFIYYKLLPYIQQYSIDTK